jgi:molybdenum cofactor sulfurtransferase
MLCVSQGQLYPLSWIDQVHAKSDASNTYLVVLDAAAYAATHALDLSAVQPDFVPVSFYKLFGYPTGLGALLVRKEAARQLNKVYFGGGRCALLQNIIIVLCYVTLYNRPV